MDAPASTADVLSQALGSSTGEPDVAAPATPEPAAPAATAASAATAAPEASSSEPTSSNGPSVDNLVNRLRALGASDGDLEEITRHYKGYQEYKSATSTPSDPFAGVADQLMKQVEPALVDQHEDYRRTYGDQAYVAAMMSRKDEPDENDDDGQGYVDPSDPETINRMIQEGIQKALNPFIPTLVQTDRERKRSALHERLTPHLDALKVPEHVREYFTKEVENDVARIARDNPNMPLKTIIEDRWNSLKGLLDVVQKTTTDGLKADTQPSTAPATPAAPPPIKEPDTSEMRTVEDRLGSVFKAAAAAEAEGAS